MSEIKKVRGVESRGAKVTVCPKCSKPNEHDLDHCLHCGIVFTRYQQVQERRRAEPKTRERPKRPRRRYAPLPFFQMGHHARFFRRLARMIDAGTSLTQAIKGLRGTGGVPARLVEQVIPLLDQGAGLVPSLEQVRASWPSFVWAHLEAGEASGTLPKMLTHLADEIDHRRKRILAHIFNWRTLWFFLMLLGASFSLSVTGAVRNLGMEDVDKGVAGILAGIFTGAVLGFIFYIGMFLLFCLGFAWFQITGKHRLTQRFPGFENLRLRMPLFAQISINESLGRYFTLLSTMLDSGLTLPRSLDLAQADIEFPLWRGRFSAVREAVEQGAFLSSGSPKIRVPKCPTPLETPTFIFGGSCAPLSCTMKPSSPSIAAWEEMACSNFIAWTPPLCSKPF